MTAAPVGPPRGPTGVPVTPSPTFRDTIGKTPYDFFLMNIDWSLVRQIALPTFTLILGKFIDDRFTKRPKLLTWFASSAAFNVAGERPVTLHVHALVIRNAGAKTAHNVRLGHHILPKDFTVSGNVNFNTTRNPNGSGEIVLPTLVSGEQVTISYLYFPPVLWSDIHAYTKSDEGGVENISVLPTPQPPTWLVRVLLVLALGGAVTAIYLMTLFVQRFP